MNRNEDELIRTNGGPLVCIRFDLAAQWGGIRRISKIADSDLQSDYEVACAVTNYLQVIDFMRSDALVFGDMPLDTGLWIDESNSKLIFYRIIFADSVRDAREFASHETYIAEYPMIEEAQFLASKSRYAVFDSAMAGDEYKNCINFDVSPGEYRIGTYHVNQLDRMNLVIHRAEKI
jgi:hypothetical protein